MSDFHLPDDLREGDVLLYKPTSFYGSIIRIKTWHNVSHCELYMGKGISAASRDGKGVNFYPARVDDALIYVLRPTLPFNAENAKTFVTGMVGTPYGWLDLLDFVGFHVDKKGIVCSPFLTLALRAGGIPVFNNEPANSIAPFQFLTSEYLQELYVADHR